VRSIFFIASEEKEYVCLAPLYSEVSKSKISVKIFKFFEEAETSGSGFLSFLDDPYPIVVVATPSTLHYISSVRPRWSYTAVGCEHGISPFKKFTYSDGFLDYDHYFAPTALWLNRLQALYPDRRTHFHQGDYPRLEELKGDVQRLQGTDPPDRLPESWRNENPKIRQLVVFTWGIDEQALRSLPDKNGIVYLLHPAQAELTQNVSFENASLLVSKPEITSALIAFANVVFGDLSSLTLETAYMHPKTYLVLDRALYIKDHNLDEELLDRGSKYYAMIPQTDLRIEDRYILDLSNLRRCLADGEVEDSFSALSLNARLLPPNRSRENSFCAEGIMEIANSIHEYKAGWEQRDYRSVVPKFLVEAYRAILGRDPDHEGLRTYMQILQDSDETPLVAGLSILMELARSEEGRAVASRRGISWPQIVIE